ncbi:GNAT family N-acetyltransferase [Alkalibacillus silvisoli]|uniref:GNAT family N-acetyltransferase n=1 Tax=Alkalibacillus silvisoli TaxID=392823 RepID=A0ABN0ZLI4_9BACI
MNVRCYQPKDEVSWLRCRVLSFLDTAYYDNVLQEKETYENPSIEIVVEEKGQVVGLLDLELEEKEQEVCTASDGLGAMMWHIAVHPDHQRQGIGEKLLRYAEEKVKQRGLSYIEAWTRDDQWVNAWYEKQGFQKVSSYNQVYISGEESHYFIDSKIPEVKVLSSFAHYLGNEPDIKNKFERIYECSCYTKRL